jgi:hypothetical protein
VATGDVEQAITLSQSHVFESSSWTRFEISSPRNIVTGFPPTLGALGEQNTRAVTFSRSFFELMMIQRSLVRTYQRFWRQKGDAGAHRDLFEAGAKSKRKSPHMMNCDDISVVAVVAWWTSLAY